MTAGTITVPVKVHSNAPLGATGVSVADAADFGRSDYLGTTTPASPLTVAEAPSVTSIDPADMWGAARRPR